MNNMNNMNKLSESLSHSIHYKQNKKRHLSKTTNDLRQ